MSAKVERLSSLAQCSRWAGWVGFRACPNPIHYNYILIQPNPLKIKRTWWITQLKSLTIHIHWIIIQLNETTIQTRRPVGWVGVDWITHSRPVHQEHWDKLFLTSVWEIMLVDLITRGRMRSARVRDWIGSDTPIYRSYKQGGATKCKEVISSNTCCSSGSLPAVSVSPGGNIQ